MSGVVLDAGGLIALESHHRSAYMLVKRLLNDDEVVAVPSTALAQVVRDLQKQVSLARLLRHSACQVVDLDRAGALAVGRLLSRTRTKDVVDAHVAVVARDLGLPVLTSDAKDLRRLDPSLRLEEV